MAISALTLSSVDEQIKLLGVAPQILPRLQQLLSDGNTNPDDIMDLIKLDTALATRVIRTSNCAYFSRGIEITSIEDGVTYLGYDEVYRIMMILAFANMMRGPLAAFGLGPDALWRRALACALSIEGLAKTVGMDRRAAYTTGLIHGVGMIFVDYQLKQSDPGSVKPDSPEDEVRLLGLTHAEVGAYVLRKWEFPESTVEAVRCQFTPLDSTNYTREACLLNAAKFMMAAITERVPDGEEAPAPDPLVLTMLGATDEDYQEVLEEAEGKFTLLELATSDF